MPFQKGATRLGPKPKSLPLAEGTVQRGGREKNASSPARLLACVPGRPSTTSRVRSCATVSISSISTTTSITTTPTLPSQHPTIIPLRHLAPSLVTASLSSTLTVSATANTFRHPLSASSSPTPLATSFFSATLAMMPPLPSPQPPRLHPPHHCLSSTIEPTTASIVSGVHDVLCCATLATILATVLATVLVAILAATIRSPQSCVSRGARQPPVYCKCLAYVPCGVPTSHTDRAFAQMPSVGP